MKWVEMRVSYLRGESVVLLLRRLPLSDHLLEMVLSKLNLVRQLLLELLKVTGFQARLEC